MAHDSQVIQAHAFARRGDAVGVEQTVQVQVVLAQRFAMNCERMELDLSHGPLAVSVRGAAREKQLVLMSVGTRACTGGSVAYGVRILCKWGCGAFQSSASSY